MTLLLAGIKNVVGRYLDGGIDFALFYQTVHRSTASDSLAGIFWLKQGLTTKRASENV